MKMKYRSATVLGLTLLLTVGTTDNGCESASQKEQRQLESNQNRLIRETPPPHLNTSQERLNLIKRHERINNVKDLVGTITLIQEGRVVMSLNTKGKPTSLNAYLTGKDTVYGGGQAGYATVEAPDHDGTYGENRAGVFFFTLEDDSYMEWTGDFLWTDRINASRIPVERSR